jgi:hypothetical protein
MPYNFTHALVGLTALNQSNSRVQALVREHGGAFLCGTMGPDPYFGDEMPKPLFSPCRKTVADRLHATDMREIVKALLPLAADSPAKRAYALGFLCHFLLDTNAHPYIEARYSGKAHTPAEIQIDLMMTDRASVPGVPAPPKRFYRTPSLAELDALHAALVKALFGLETSGAFKRSFRKWMRINTISYDPKNRKLRFFGCLERLFHTPGRLTGFLVARHPDPCDRLNLAHTVWRAPWKADEARTESFPELFEHACAEAPALLGAALYVMESGSFESGDPEAVLSLIGARRMDAKPV